MKRFKNIKEADLWYVKVFEAYKKEAVKNGQSPKFGETEAFRFLGRNDLWFLLTVLLNRTDLRTRKEINPEWAFQRCQDVQESPDGHLDLWAREHYKSTIITFGKTIQDILKDPDITVGIFSHTANIAQGFSSQIKNELQNNEKLKELYPDVLYENPKKESLKWSDSAFVVKRKSNPNAATVEAWGLVKGQPTSRHFSLMVYDDVVTLESVSNVDMINKTTEAWEMSRSLASHGGKVRYIGTRYHANDTWKILLKRKVAEPRLFPATDNGKDPLTDGGRSVFLRQDDLERKRREQGPYTFGCQMLQDPCSDSVQGFKAEWVTHYNREGSFDNMNIYILVDPASEKKVGSDYTVMLVMGLASDGNYYLIDGLRDRLNLTERTSRLFMLHKKYKPIYVGYEQYGQQSDIEHIESVMSQEKYRFSILPVGGKVSKIDRIRKLVPLFEAKKVLIPYEHQLQKVNYEGGRYDLVRSFIEEEYLPFPVSIHDDMLDCMARIVDPNLGASFPKEGGSTLTNKRVTNFLNEYNPIQELYDDYI